MLLRPAAFFVDSIAISFFTKGRSRPLAIFALAACLTPGVSAQEQAKLTGQAMGVSNTTSTPVAGVPHDYITGIDEVVDPANGSLSIRLKVPTPHERGVNTPSYVYQWNSNGIWSLQPTGWNYGQGPYGNSFDKLNGLTLFPQSFGGPVTSNLKTTHQSGQYTTTTYTCNVSSGFMFADFDGGVHSTGLGTAHDPNNMGGCSAFPGANYSNIGGDLQYKAFLDTSSNNLREIVVDLHGDLVTASVDPNGQNGQWLSAATPSQPRPFEDTNGNYFNTTNRTWSIAGTGTTHTFTFPGVAGSYVVTNDMSAPAPSFSINVHNVGDTSNNFCNVTTASTASQGVQTYKSTTIQLPNGQSYVIQYDTTYGLVNSIKYPTGATVTYTWQTVPYQEGVQYRDTQNAGAGGGTCLFKHDWFAIHERDVSFDGKSTAQKQIFTYETDFPADGHTSSNGPFDAYMWTNKTTTVQTTDVIRGQSFTTTYAYTPVLPPPATDPTGYWGDHGYVPQEKTVTYLDFSGDLIKTVTRVWQDFGLLAGECETIPLGGTKGTFYTYQPYIGFGGLNTLNPEAKMTNLPKDVADYDYGQVNSSCSKPDASVVPLRETMTQYHDFGTTPLFPYPSILDRPDFVKIYGSVNGKQVLQAETDYGYDETAPVSETKVPFGHDPQFDGSSNLHRGNVTTIQQKCFAGAAACTDSIQKMTYDTAGQVRSITDGCGNQACSEMSGSNHDTKFTYDDNYTNDDGSSPGNTYAYVTSITRSFPGTTYSSTFQYGFQDGRLRASTDENSQSTYYTYSLNSCGGGSGFDPFFRVTGVSYPDQGRKTVCYSDAGPTPMVTTSSLVRASQPITTTVMYDAYGHATQTQMNTDPDGPSYTDSTYDGMGWVYKLSNPYRGSSGNAQTTFTYDAEGNKVGEQYPDGNSRTWCYNWSTNLARNACAVSFVANTHTAFVDAYDEHGALNQHATDALGRLLAVKESNQGSGTLLGAETDYTYDALGNLTSAIQNGNPQLRNPGSARVRTFTYDSLSRLLTASNPESGITCYGQWSGSNCVGGYDANGNLVVKTDANGVPVFYNYDTLNRLTAITANVKPTVDANFFYDDPKANGIGRLIGHAKNGVSGESYAYDLMGRIAFTGWCHYNQGRPNLPGCTGQPGMSVQYDLGGNPSQLTYPDGRVITQTWTTAGRLGTVQDATPNGAHQVYFNGPASSSQGVTQQYWPSGALQAATLGNGVSESFTVNSRLQPCRSSASSSLLPSAPNGVGNLWDRQSYYSAQANAACGDESGNNGNIMAIVDNRQPSFTQSFSYDPLNRLLTATRQDGAFDQSYTYDEFGNMTAQDSVNTIPAYSVMANNRLDLNGTFGYDNDGHITQVPNPAGGSHTFFYEPEGYLRCIDGCGQGSLGSYLNDALGQRSYVSRPTFATWPVYLNGQVMAEYTDSGKVTDYIYADGQKIAKVEANKPILHLHGTRGDAANMNWGTEGSISGVPAYNYVIQAGDTVSMNFMQTSATDGGLALIFNNGAVGTGDLTDIKTGTQFYFNQVGDSTWHSMTGDLTPWQGDTFAFLLAGIHNKAPAGDFDMYITDAAIHTVDGRTLPLITGQATSVPNFSGQNGGAYNLSSATELTAVSDPAVSTNYYVNDHLGTTEVELSGGGWPVWQGQYTPFGQEVGVPYSIGPQSADGASTHFKFTGKERDQESGLDYFGARYYSSVIGRFSSPDWASKPEAVPYSSLDNPQSLNLYTYVGNNPLSRADIDGHCDPNGGNCSVWDHVAGAVGGVLNVVPGTLNLGIQAINAVSGAVGGPQLDPLPMIQADTHASQTGLDVGTAATIAYPAASVAADITTAGSVVGEIRTATAGESVPESIPAGPSARPTSAQQGQINQMGDAHGCSTCGASSPGTKSGNWVGDHQPPTALKQPGESQVYKPQCLQCSRQQGGQVRAAQRAAQKKVDTPQ